MKYDARPYDRFFAYVGNSDGNNHSDETYGGYNIHWMARDTEKS